MSAHSKPNDLTRQQLDELDTLLQRMLKLPLSGTEEAPEPTPSVVKLPTPPKPRFPSEVGGSWRPDLGDNESMPHRPESVSTAEPELATVAASEMPLQAKLEEPTPAKQEAVALFGPPQASDAIPPSTRTVRGVDAPALPADFRSVFAEHAERERISSSLVEPEQVDDPIPLLTQAPATESVESVPVLAWPLVAMNWVCELPLKMLGVSESSTIKNGFAVVGLTLIAAAVAWSAQGMGWITLPIPGR